MIHSLGEPHPVIIVFIHTPMLIIWADSGLTFLRTGTSGDVLVDGAGVTRGMHIKAYSESRCCIKLFLHYNITRLDLEVVFLIYLFSRFWQTIRTLLTHTHPHHLCLTIAQTMVNYLLFTHLYNQNACISLVDGGIPGIYMEDMHSLTVNHNTAQ